MSRRSRRGEGRERERRAGREEEEEEVEDVRFGVCVRVDKILQFCLIDDVMEMERKTRIEIAT